MDEALKKSLDKFGSHFVVASMVPSLAFVVATLIIFGRNLQILPFPSSESDQFFDIFSITLILLIPTIIIGFTLTVLNTYIFKFFEGYSFFWRFSPLLRHQKNKAAVLSCEIEKVARTIERLEKRKKSRRAINDLSLLKDEYYRLASKYDQLYPPSTVNILPTNFGNTLRASETYPSTRYGIDAVSFWPRMVQVIPDRYQSYIDQSRNEVSFLLNCSVLSFFLLLCCIVATVFEIRSIFEDFKLAAIFQYPLVYILLVILFIGLTLFFYRAANVVVTNFGFMIRSTYDLFRLDLLNHLKIKLPTNSHDEFYLWKKIGEFIVLGTKSMDFDILEYNIKD